jgi:transposase InsO family protein
VAIDRTAKFAFVARHENATPRVAADFLRALLETVPDKIHTVLTDKGTPFTTPGNNSSAVPAITLAWQTGAPFRAHTFEPACAQHDIDHRLTKPKHPWTNGPVERMNRTRKEATVLRYSDQSHHRLRSPLADFVAADNCARRLKTLKGLTPDEYICQAWTKQPERFILDPTHQIPGLNS